MKLKSRFLTQEFLGERLVPELEVDTVQYYDHLRRYLFAQQEAYGRTVLDIACGTGYGSDLLRRAGARQVFSLDISAGALAYADRHWANLRLVQASAMQLPLADDSFDLVVSFETLEHLPDPAAFLSEARRILRRGGHLILSTPNRAWVSPGSDTPFSPYHTFEPTQDELIDLLQTNGWEVLDFYGMTYSPPVQAMMCLPQGHYERPTGQIAWSAYVRLLVREMLPPFVYRWLRQLRKIPKLAITDSILVHEPPQDVAYYVVKCQPTAS